MVEKICNKLTRTIKKQMPELSEERLEAINYGLQLLVGEIPKTFIFVAIALIFGIFKEFLITLLVVFPYRMFSGGFHLKTHTGCIVMTSLFYCGTAYISKFYLFSINVKYLLLICIWIFGIIMCKLYAPADTEYVPILRAKDRRTKQILSYVVLTVLISVGLIINSYVISNIIIFGCLIQSIMISKPAYKIVNCKYGYEVYTNSKRATT